MRRFSREAYEKAIAALEAGRSQLEPDGRLCAVCADGGHQAWECRHNPLVMMDEAEAGRHAWRCYHCGEVLTTEEAAAEHFGEPGTDWPLCVAVKDGGAEGGEDG